MDPVRDRGPWTQSIKVVHGPGPRWGSMDPWSMFCPHPAAGAYIWRGNLMDGFLRYRIGRLIYGGAYTWRGLFSEFYSISLE